MHLALRSKNRDDVGSGLLIREAEFTVRLILDIVNKNAFIAQQDSVVLAWYGHLLEHIVPILFQTQNCIAKVGGEISYIPWG